MKTSRLILLLGLLMAAAPLASAQEYTATPVTISKEKVKLNGKVYLSHVVLERQTLYSIAKAYGVTVEEIYEANPGLQETGLQKNAIILVPFAEGRGTATVAVPLDDEVPADSAQIPYKEHTVRWFEDIDDIAKRYGVSVKDIMEFNKLKSRRLSTRQVIRIPLGPVSAAPAEESQAEEETPSQPDDSFVPDEDFFTRFTGKSSVDMALVLPFNASGQPSETNMDFYSGVLMAVKDMQIQGISTQLNVYDLNAGIPSREQLTANDFVLGPVASRELEAVLERSAGDVPVISPLDPRASSLSETYRNFIQAPTAIANQYEALAAWVKQEAGAGDRIVLITEKAAKNATPAVAIRNALMHQEITYDILTYGIVEGRGIPAILTQKIDKKGVNHLVVASESEAFVSDVMRNVSIMIGKGYRIALYAPSKVRTFDTIDGSLFHQGNLHIASTYHVDYESAAVRDFLLAYRALYRTEPSQFAFQGYDTARYFITMCAKYGKHFPAALQRTPGYGLHTDFHFAPSAGGALLNSAVRRVLYKTDYTTELVR